MQVNGRHIRAQRYCLTSVVFLLLLVTAACRGTESITAEPATEPPTRSTAELETLFWARMDSARTLFTDADVEFMTGMIGHHAQALIMAGLAPTHGASATVQTLCARIINAQQDEIATMQQWLRSRGQPVPEVLITGTTLMIHGVGDRVTHMPGMLTEEQMQGLDEAQGVDFDRLFLTYMIQHHNGAIVMVDELFSEDGAGQDELAFKLASDINADQITEIARMERMLSILSRESPNR
ncbi:MAG: hypothetical protein BMS9Abin05_1338 [Rhodothermia bacterium]|nr:MAG: hypothetical protein BMS9Abin05_1338 [Rhodothermia bacterium]